MATFVMQSLGCEVAALNTVQFSENFYSVQHNTSAIVDQSVHEVLFSFACLIERR
jgi:pyridoxal/pyridoxine/pyridoxamine kinase